MKKIAIIVAMLVCLYANFTNAQTYEGDPRLYWSNVPVICGITDNVKLYLEENEFVLESFSVGRQGAKQDGQPVYMVTYYVSKKQEQSATTIDVPSQLERCMLFHSFDLTKPSLNTN